jgi:hypothetical protein
VKELFVVSTYSFLNKKREHIAAKIKKYIKNWTVLCQPYASLENFVNNGITKKPIDADPVTIPTDIVLFLSEKYLPTAATGTDTAVPPRAVPMITPILTRKIELDAG